MRIWDLVFLTKLSKYLCLGRSLGGLRKSYAVFMIKMYCSNLGLLHLSTILRCLYHPSSYVQAIRDN